MITVKNLYKSYGDQTILNGVDTQFPAHKITSLIGPNGAGKTTLLMAIGRLLNGEKGEILLGGTNTATMPISEYAKHVATLRQAPDFNMKLTVEELVAFGRFPYNRGRLDKKDQHAIDEAISLLSLGGFRRCLIDELSGGQRQMAFLAMTVAQQTSYLLLDEPLNNLDMKHAVEIMQSLRHLCDQHKRTIILVVHEINFAANYSDHIVAMKSGSVFKQGPTPEVINEAVLKDLYGLDFEIVTNDQGCLCNYFNPPRKSK